MRVWALVKKLLICWSLPLLVLIVLNYQTLAPLSYVMAEPQAIMGLPWYTGAFAVIAGTFWFSAAAIILFSASLLVKDRTPLVAMGLFSAWLGLDDLLMLHESALPHLLKTSSSDGHAQPLIFVCYGLVMLGCLFMDRKFLKRLEALPLYIALVFFAISMGIDILSESNLLMGSKWLSSSIFKDDLIEDSFKLFAIVTWFFYFVLRSRLALLEGEIANG